MTSSTMAARVVRSGFGLRSVALLLVGFYRAAISPSLPRTCRFTPSCSAYAEEALRRHGLLRALGLIVRRVARCHPFHPGGHDPVP